MFGFIAWLVDLAFYAAVLALLWRILRVQTALLRLQQEKPVRAPARKRATGAKEKT